MAPEAHSPLGPSLRARLDAIESQGLRRRRRVVERAEPAGQGVRAIVDGTAVLSFCSNDYLGLAHHPAVTDAFIASAREHGVGSGASHLITGHQREHHALEEDLADFTGRPRALLFSTGYMANLGLAGALIGRSGLIVGDRLNHASLIDAGRLARAELRHYPHADPGALESSLAERAGRDTLVLTDGVFSMDGDIAPLPELAAACRRHGAWLAVDDAHGLGVVGASGRGSLEHHSLRLDDVPILVGTLGKAFGTFGAFVAGEEALIEQLIQSARTYLYTTALPPAVAAATRAALRVIEAEPWRRQRVLALTQRFRELALQAGLPVLESRTPIQPIMLSTPESATAASAQLLEAGLLVTAIRPPTVPTGTSRLRVTFSAEHSEADVERLVTELARALPAR